VRVAAKLAESAADCIGLRMYPGWGMGLANPERDAEYDRGYV